MILALPGCPAALLRLELRSRRGSLQDLRHSLARRLSGLNWAAVFTVVQFVWLKTLKASTRIWMKRLLFTVIKLLEDRHIPVVQAGPANRVDTRIVADASFRSRSKTTGVDVRTDGSVSMLLIRIAGQHNARGKIFTAGNQSVQGGAIRGRQCA